MTLPRLLALPAFVLLFAACNESSPKRAETAPTAPTATASAGAPSADAPPNATASPEAAATTPLAPGEHDLSKAGTVWQGWVAGGPEKARVLADDIKDARLAVDGKGMLAAGPPEDELDISFRQESQSLDEKKAHIKSYPTTPFTNVTRKIVIITDKPDRLEWSDSTTRKGGKTWTSYQFIMNFQVLGTDVSCATNERGGGAITKEGLAQFESVCLTLHNNNRKK